MLKTVRADKRIVEVDRVTRFKVRAVALQ